MRRSARTHARPPSPPSHTYSRARVHVHSKKGDRDRRMEERKHSVAKTTCKPCEIGREETLPTELGRLAFKIKNILLKPCSEQYYIHSSSKLMKRSTKPCWVNRGRGREDEQEQTKKMLSVRIEENSSTKT